MQKENTKQKEIIRLVDPRTLQNKAAETIFEFQNLKTCELGIQFSMKLTMSSVNIYCTFCRNIKYYSKYLKHTSFSTSQVLVLGLTVREYKFAASRQLS